MSLPTGTDYGLKANPAPTSDQSNVLMYADLAAVMPDSWWNACDTDDVGKLRFSLDDDTEDAATELAFSVINFDRAAKTGLAFWLIPTVTNASPGSTRIYPAKASNASYGSGDTFGSDACFASWKVFMPLNEDPSGSAPQFADLSGNGHNGTAVGSMTAGDSVAGKVGNGVEGDGSDDEITLATSVNVAGGDTVYLWAAPGTDGVVESLIGDNTGTRISLNTNNERIDLTADSGHTDVLNPVSAWTIDQYYHIAISANTNSSVSLYVDGNADDTQDASAFDSYTIDRLLNSSADGFSSGKLALFGVESVENRTSPDRASYYHSMQNDPATFWGTFSWEGATQPIAGTIEDEAGNPVENAIVKIFDDHSILSEAAPTFIETVLTDANGDWSMQAAYDETLGLYKIEYKYFKAEYSGTINSATDSSFTDTSSPFTVGEFDDGQAIVRITSGAADGDERQIDGNADTDTCDIDGTWSTNPSDGDDYEVGYMYSDELKFKPPKSAA